MKDAHLRLGIAKFVCGQHEAVLHTVVLILIEETLLLDAGHVKDIEVGDGLLDCGHLAAVHAVLVADLLAHIAREAELFGSNEHDLDSLETGERLDQGVDGASEL